MLLLYLAEQQQKTYNLCSETAETSWWLIKYNSHIDSIEPFGSNDKIEDLADLQMQKLYVCI